MNIPKLGRSFAGACAYIALISLPHISFADDEQVIVLAPFIVNETPDSSWTVPIDYYYKTSQPMGPATLVFQLPVFTITAGPGTGTTSTMPAPSTGPTQTQQDACITSLANYTATVKASLQQEYNLAQSDANTLATAFAAGITKGAVMQFVDAIPGIHSPDMAAFYSLIQTSADNTLKNFAGASLNTIGHVTLALAYQTRMGQISDWNSQQTASCQTSATFQTLTRS